LKIKYKFTKSGSKRGAYPTPSAAPNPDCAPVAATISTPVTAAPSDVAMAVTVNTVDPAPVVEVTTEMDDTTAVATIEPSTTVVTEPTTDPVVETVTTFDDGLALEASDAPVADDSLAATTESIPASDAPVADDSLVATTVAPTDAATTESIPASDAPVADDSLAATTVAPTDAATSESAPVDDAPVADDSLAATTESVPASDAPVVTTTGNDIVQTVTASDSSDTIAQSSTSLSLDLANNGNDITGSTPSVGTEESMTLTGDGTPASAPVSTGSSLFPVDPALSLDTRSEEATLGLGTTTVAATDNSSVDSNVMAIDPMTKGNESVFPNECAAVI
jgi:hypothetical protein